MASSRSIRFEGITEHSEDEFELALDMEEAKTMFAQIRRIVGDQNKLNHTELMKQKIWIDEMLDISNYLQESSSDTDDDALSAAKTPPMNQSVVYEFTVKKIEVENSIIFMNADVVRLKVLIDRLLVHEIYETTVIDNVEDSHESRDRLKKIYVYSKAFIDELRAAHRQLKADDPDSVEAYQDLVEKRLLDFPLDG